MKNRLFFHAIWMLATLIAFCVGHFTADSPTTPETRDIPGAAPRIDATPRDAALTFDESNRATTGVPVVLSGDQARVRTFELLSVPDRVDRLRQLCELLRSATAENWRGVMEAFVRHTVTTGQNHPDEWRLTMERLGQVAGSVAIEEVLASKEFRDQGGRGKNGAQLMLTGWAVADPKAAQAWLEAQPPEIQDTMATALINGLARSDPQSALAFVAAHRPEPWNEFASQIVDGIFQRAGAREGEELLATIRERGDIAVPMKRAVFYEIAMRQIDAARLRGEPARALDWADQYMGPSLMGPLAAKEIVKFAAQGDALATLNWIEARTDRWTPEQAAIVFPAIAQAVQSRTPEQFAAWMNANPGHPQHDVMAQAIASLLLQNGDPGEARRWSNTIGDAAIRAAMERALKTTEEKLRRNNSQ